MGRDIIVSIKPDADVASVPEPTVAGFVRWSSNPFYCVQYLSSTRGATVLWGGDSHFAGDTTPGGVDAFPLRSCLKISTPDCPVAGANYAWGGSPSMIFLPILDRMLEACRPQFVVLQGWTANDGPAEASAIAYSDQILRLAAKARQMGAFPIMSTRFPRNTLARNPDELRVTEWLRRRQLALSGREMVVLDAAEVLDDPLRPGTYRDGLSNDGVHPNDAGHAAVERLLTAALRELIECAD
jgi:hypothetical protein